MRMKDTGEPSILGYALLGLLQQQPLSGYDLRKFFSTSPMGAFSDSPGAIYPALRRLRTEKYICGEVEKGPGLRQREVFHLTPDGLAQLKAWLRKPVTRENVDTGMEELLLRFAFTDGVLGKADSKRLLQEIEREIKAYIPSLRQYLHAHSRDMSLSGRLAVENGIEMYEAQLRWIKRAIRAYGETEQAS